jgi:hypothetical protein
VFGRFRVRAPVGVRGGLRREREDAVGQSEEGRRMRRVQKREDRKDGWTEEKKDRFIEVLEATCNISAALRTVAMSASGLARLRERDGAFRARMMEARRRAYVDLEFFALEKIMAGTVKTVTKADGKVETVHEYPLTQALQLLRLHRDVAEGHGGSASEEAAEPSEEQRAEVVERLMRKMRKLRERMDAEEAAAAAAAVAPTAGNGEESGDAAEAGQ